MTKNELVSKAKLMIESPSCCAELKKKAQIWIESIGTADEKIKAQNLIAGLKENVRPIDSLIAFAKSDEAVQIFGNEGAKNMLKHANELKAKGAKYCDCAACSAGLEILNNKEEIIK